MVRRWAHWAAIFWSLRRTRKQTKYVTRKKKKKHEKVPAKSFPRKDSEDFIFGR